MDKQEQPAGPSKFPTGQVRGSPHHGMQDPSRRRFGRAGASGVLLTLASKPVLGAVALAPSGFVSANQSSHGRKERNISLARKPDYWQETAVWPTPQDTPLASVFPVSPGSPLAQATLGQVIAGHKDDKQQLVRHLAAAVLNARSGWSPFLTEDRIQAMYIELHTQGYFAPMANVQWMANDVVRYLKSTQS